MGHTCHAIGCDKEVPPEMFMCRRHWYMVPVAGRRAIWATYRPGQCDDWNPSGAYCRNAARAVRIVAEKEGRTVTGDEPELKLYEYFESEAE